MKKTSPVLILYLAAMLLIMNIMPLAGAVKPLIVTAAILLPLVCAALLAHILPGSTSDPESKRLRRLKKGADLVWLGGWAAAAETVILIIFFIVSDAGAAVKILSVVIPVLTAALILFTGVIRITAGAKQIKLRDHVLLLCLWWCPVVNIFIIRKFYKTARREYVFESDKEELDNIRAESQICKTKYPILLVHGIFFRDWQLVNYWGRIPAALIRNGAKVYYGGQQSAMHVCDSAAELKKTIEKIIAETGAEKVNIIAHSKGGLDSRYAISCLGMDRYVATLTTINTPHKGCDMVDYLLDRTSEGFQSFLHRKYGSIFTRLGDTTPDFLAGVHDLSAERAKSYDEEMPDSPAVSYRSVMSIMSSAGSAGLPLNIGYLLIKKLNGANDGLVWEDSAVHGSHRLITTKKKRGLSHGDIIDLMRENIEGFDVREFYVSMVSELRDQGF